MVAVEWHGYLHECQCPLPRLQTVATPRVLVVILMRARLRLSDYGIRRKIEEKRRWTNTFDVGKSLSCLVAGLTWGVSWHSACGVLWWCNHSSATAIWFWYGATASSKNIYAQNKYNISLLTWPSHPFLSHSHLCTPPPAPLPLFFSFLPYHPSSSEQQTKWWSAGHEVGVGEVMYMHIKEVIFNFPLLWYLK